MGQLAEQTIIEAGNELGVKEATGHNDGPAVKMFLNSVGLPEGYAWCMAFVYWCVRGAAAKLNLKNPLVQSGGVLDEWERVNQDYKLTVPEEGCVFIMDFGHGEGHAGIVTGVFLDQGIVHTIEGNTNTDGSREGIGVFRKTREISSFKGFIKLIDIPL